MKKFSEVSFKIVFQRAARYRSQNRIPVAALFTILQYPLDDRASAALAHARSPRSHSTERPLLVSAATGSTFTSAETLVARIAHRFPSETTRIVTMASSSAASMSTISSAAAFRAGRRRSTARRSRAVRPNSLAFFRPPVRAVRRDPRVATSRRVAPRPDPRRRSRAPSEPSREGFL